MPRLRRLLESSDSEDLEVVPKPATSKAKFAVADQLGVYENRTVDEILGGTTRFKWTAPTKATIFHQASVHMFSAHDKPTPEEMHGLMNKLGFASSNIDVYYILAGKVLRFLVGNVTGIALTPALVETRKNDAWVAIWSEYTIDWTEKQLLDTNFDFNAPQDGMDIGARPAGPKRPALSIARIQELSTRLRRLELAGINEANTPRAPSNGHTASTVNELVTNVAVAHGIQASVLRGMVEEAIRACRPPQDQAPAQEPPAGNRPQTRAVTAANASRLARADAGVVGMTARAENDDRRATANGAGPVSRAGLAVPVHDGVAVEIVEDADDADVAGHADAAGHARPRGGHPITAQRPGLANRAVPAVSGTAEHHVAVDAPIRGTITPDNTGRERAELASHRYPTPMSPDLDLIEQHGRMMSRSGTSRRTANSQPMLAAEKRRHLNNLGDRLQGGAGAHIIGQEMVERDDADPDAEDDNVQANPYVDFIRRWG